MITEQDYIKAEEQYIRLTEDELQQLAMKAAEEQPALFAYIANYYSFLKKDYNKDFFIQLVYSTWISYTNKYEWKKKLTIEEVEKMDEAEGKRLFDLYENQDAIIGEALRRMTEHPQALLIGHIYTQIGDFFDVEQLDDDNPEEGSYQDAGITSGVIISFINLLEKARQPLYIS